MLEEHPLQGSSSEGLFPGRGTALPVWIAASGHWASAGKEILLLGISPPQEKTSAVSQMKQTLP